MNLNLNLNLDEFVHYNHKFKMTADTMPKEGTAAYITSGAPDWLLYNKHMSWQICAERSLYYDFRGRLGLVVGKIILHKNALVDKDGKKLNGSSDGKVFRVDFTNNCRGMWGQCDGIIKVGVTRTIEICTIRDYIGKDTRFKELIGATKVVIDGAVIEELNYVPVNSAS